MESVPQHVQDADERVQLPVEVVDYGAADGYVPNVFCRIS